MVASALLAVNRTGHNAVLSRAKTTLKSSIHKWNATFWMEIKLKPLYINGLMVGATGIEPVTSPV